MTFSGLEGVAPSDRGGPSSSAGAVGGGPVPSQEQRIQELLHRQDILTRCRDSLSNPHNLIARDNTGYVNQVLRLLQRHHMDPPVGPSDRIKVRMLTKYVKDELQKIEIEKSKKNVSASVPEQDKRPLTQPPPVPSRASRQERMFQLFQRAVKWFNPAPKKADLPRVESIDSHEALVPDSQAHVLVPHLAQPVPPPAPLAPSLAPLAPLPLPPSAPTLASLVPPPPSRVGLPSAFVPPSPRASAVNPRGAERRFPHQLRGRVRCVSKRGVAKLWEVTIPDPLGGGEGTNSKVYHAVMTRIKEGRIYKRKEMAFYVPQDPEDRPTTREDLIHGCRMSRILRDRHGIKEVLKNYDVTYVDEKGREYAIAPWAAQGTFANFITRQASSVERMKIALEFTHGISEMHKKGYCHLDIKLANALVATDSKETTGALHGRIADLGSVKAIGQKTFACSTIMPPEMKAERDRIKGPRDTDQLPVSPALDLWPLGEIVYAMKTGESLLTIPLSQLRDRMSRLTGAIVSRSVIPDQYVIPEGELSEEAREALLPLRHGGQYSVNTLGQLLLYCMPRNYFDKGVQLVKEYLDLTAARSLDPLDTCIAQLFSIDPKRRPPAEVVAQKIQGWIDRQPVASH